MRLLALSLVLLSVSNVSWAGSTVREDCVVEEDGSQTCTATTSTTMHGKDFDADKFDDDDDEYPDDDDDDALDIPIVDDKEDDDNKKSAEKEAAPVVPLKPEPAAPIASCIDTHEMCSFWAGSGECNNNPNYMLNNCKKSCNNCEDRKLTLAASSEQMRLMEEDVVLAAVANYGLEQKVQGKDKLITMLVIRKTVDYMKNFVHAETPTHRLSEAIIKECTNNNELCAFWAAIGECENNISFMQTKCAPSCQSCANIDFDTRCPKRPSDEKPALLPGQLNKMFERIIANAPGNQTDETQLFAKEKKVQEDGTPYYTVHVHSRPESVGDMDQTMTVQDGAFSTKVSEASRDQDLKEKPWVVTFENFLTDEECDHLVQLGHDNVYSRSKDVGTKMADGSYSAKESTTRTSENAWCSAKTGCRNDDIATRVRDRISKLVQIQSRNFEDFQMLKYDEGQFYALHHDYIPHQVDRASGPRILTFFLYLSDVEEGGGTGLNRINEGLVVNPKKGKALLWPSVLNYDPTVKDGRTTHEAIAVVKGTKFAANAWIHLYDNVETQKRGCT